jgi:Spy/CpxP family protein refolding chaperone
MMKKLLLVTMAAVLFAGGAAFAQKKGAGPEKERPCMDQGQGPGQDCPMKDGGKRGPGGPGMDPMGAHMGMGMGLQMKLKFALNNPELKKELALTADQESKLNAIQVEIEKFGIQKRAEIQLLSLDLQQEFKKDTIDVKKVQELSDKISAAGAEVFRKNMTATAEIMNILTKEQKAKLEEMRAERRQMMMKKFKENRK